MGGGEIPMKAAYRRFLQEAMVQDKFPFHILLEELSQLCPVVQCRYRKPAFILTTPSDVPHW